MGILSRFFGERAESVGRRQFLRNIITAAPAAVAAGAAIELAFVPELKAAAVDELRKMDEMVEGDLGIKDGRIQVAAPKSIFDPNVRVWRSVANEAGAWADYVSQKTGVARSAALTACMRLARLVDDDLRAAQVDTETKIDISLPNVTREWTDRNGNKQCEVGLGLHKQKLFDGSDQYAVLFKNERPKLLDSKGKEFVRPLADRGEGWNDVAALRLPAPANAGLHSVPGRGFDRKVKNDWGTPVIEYTNISQDLLPGFKPAMNV